VDGELRERNAGNYEHARLIALLAASIGKLERQWGVAGCISPRLTTSPGRVRVPDLAVTVAGPQPDVLIEPPLLVIEILSPDDTYSDTRERAEDYRNMGVETVWIIDPKTRTGRVCSGSVWHLAARLEVPGTPIFVDLQPLLDQIQSSR
jgi:Uma2 family endonuclease